MSNWSVAKRPPADALYTFNNQLNEPGTSICEYSREQAYRNYSDQPCPHGPGTVTGKIVESWLFERIVTMSQLYGDRLPLKQSTSGVPYQLHADSFNTVLNAWSREYTALSQLLQTGLSGIEQILKSYAVIQYWLNSNGLDVIKSCYAASSTLDAGEPDRGAALCLVRV